MCHIYSFWNLRLIWPKSVTRTPSRTWSETRWSLKQRLRLITSALLMNLLLRALYPAKPIFTVPSSSQPQSQFPLQSVAVVHALKVRNVVGFNVAHRIAQSPRTRRWKQYAMSKPEVWLHIFSQWVRLTFFELAVTFVEFASNLHSWRKLSWPTDFWRGFDPFAEKIVSFPVKWSKE